MPSVPEGAGVSRGGEASRHADHRQFRKREAAQGTSEVERLVGSKLERLPRLSGVRRGERSGRDPSVQRPWVAVRAFSGVSSRFAGARYPRVFFRRELGDVFNLLPRVFHLLERRILKRTAAGAEGALEGVEAARELVGGPAERRLRLDPELA